MKPILSCGVVLLASVPALAANTCTDESARALAQRVYSQHYDFYAQAQPGMQSWVSPALLRALRNHYRCEGVCHLDYDPWLGAQDGEIRPPVTFKVTRRDKSGVEVEMRYQYYIADPEPIQPQHLLLRLQSAAAPQCWRLDDLITPLGDSLKKAYSAKE